MSEVAHTSLHHANIASVQLNSEPAVTSINVSARIDYIQRFSKQVVLVIDKDPATYSKAASHFLINLSSNSTKEKNQQETNVAFVSASTKLNDIQMRCRLIEQLYANSLFDPEKSLAVSILRLSKQNKESITIVLEHAQALSLQVKYELCQLVDVANKANRKINVVLFGHEQMGPEIAKNKSIFNNKLAIIDAKSGQLFALDHARFRNETRTFTSGFWKKLLMLSSSIAALVGLSWYVLVNHDNFSLAKLPLLNSAKIEPLAIAVEAKTINAIVANKLIAQASVKDMHEAILGQSISKPVNKPKPAKATDILQALAFDKPVEAKLIIDEKSVSSTAVIQEKTAKVTSSDKLLINQLSKPNENKQEEFLTPNYYLNVHSGYVIQIAGFEDADGLASFVSQYPALQHFSYQRKLNSKEFFVITSKAFVEKEQASAAIQSLPQAIQARGPWLKSISAIKQEINTFKP